MNAKNVTQNLLWNERGAVACEQHAPFAGSDSYVWEKWKRITVDEAAAFEREVGRPPSCECCDARARRETKDRAGDGARHGDWTMSTETKPAATTETTDPKTAKQAPEATTPAPEKKPATKPTTRKASAKKPAKAPAKPRKTAPPSMPKKPAPVAKRPAKAKVTSATLADAAAGYLAQLEEDGMSEGTIGSYRSELRLAAKHLGEDTLLAELTPAKVQGFFACDAVTKTRDGRDKAAVGIAKTRRVLRQALEWAAEKGLVEEAPLPSQD